MEAEAEADSRGKSSSNLERFLSCVTPSVPLYSVTKDSFKDSNNLFQRDGGDIVECFALEDLWEWYEECSAYGLGVPVGLNAGDGVIQYYVPYLSALQIYTSKSHIIHKSNGGTEESESDWWSDDSAASEKLSKSWDDVSAVSDDMTYESEPSPKDRLGHLYLQFVEWDSPYQRIPLFDKICELSRDHPGLMSFKSAEVSPASWLAVAWYPIYHIPARGSSKEMATCFLTYHTISSMFQDCSDGKDVSCDGALIASPTKAKCQDHTTLSPFGLVTYKMQGKVWRDTETSIRISTLYSAADSWLKQLGVHHHDFNFFTNHSCK